ncbi:hypothetical protein GCM10027590_21550 [Nocardiopsis nanhaiensis]
MVAGGDEGSRDPGVLHPHHAGAGWHGRCAFGQGFLDDGGDGTAGERGGQTVEAARAVSGKGEVEGSRGYPVEVDAGRRRDGDVGGAAEYPVVMAVEQRAQFQGVSLRRWRGRGTRPAPVVRPRGAAGRRIVGTWGGAGETTV